MGGLAALEKIMSGKRKRPLNLVMENRQNVGKLLVEVKAHETSMTSVDESEEKTDVEVVKKKEVVKESPAVVVKASPAVAVKPVVEVKASPAVTVKATPVVAVQ